MSKVRLFIIAALTVAVLALSWGNSVARDAAAVKDRQAQRITLEDRLAAAERAKSSRPTGLDLAVPVQGGAPNYFGPEPNWAYSPAPTVDPMTGAISGGIRKFLDSLPGLGAAGANNLRQYIPVAVADTTTYPGSDYYEIELGEYTEKMHSDLDPTTLRGYRQTNMGGSTFHYLGPLIIAQKDRPVRIKFTNSLPTGAGGKLFLPVDTTAMGAGMGPLGMDVTPGNQMNYTENRATLHLHGNSTVWISDGMQHQWITPAGDNTDYPKGVSAVNVPDMPDPGDGSQTFFYTNEEGARLMFYHDHAFGITRLNVYSGEAAGYVLTDAVEQDLIARGILPDVGIPLIIQDRTFIDPATVLTTDPTWPFAVDPALSNLWLPHVYMPNQNPNDLSGTNYLGRWDYGPWFWPPWPVDNPPYIDPVTGLEMPNLPGLSMGMENFMDTALVNGTAYPYLDVQPKAYRFRILNAANDRFWNLQLIQADPLAPTEVPMVNFDNVTAWPAVWPTPDMRDGGIPDPNMLGPNMIQIGTEGGFLPAPVVWPNIPIGWDKDPKSMTVGNIKEHNLFLGPAERADVIVDFSAFAGQTLILYNDAPAAVPARDPRYDYYTGNMDLTAVGGAPSTLAGYGPNIRTIMQIRVANTPPAQPYDVNALNAEFISSATTVGVFARGQEPIIVPQAPYNSAYNGNFPAGTTAYERIQSLSLTFNPLDLNTPALGDQVAAPVTIQNKPKAIAEEFNGDWGRMAAFLGVEMPFTNGGNQTTLFFRVQDPVTEVIDDTTLGVQIGQAGDGTQIWKITHNGVDTHPVHFHLFNVQLVNRVDWGGVVKPPEPNELGWKETVRMNPLEDIIVALRPVSAKAPFGVPDSIRLLDPTMPQGSTVGFAPEDQYGNPVTTVNDYYNFGWEYVWHCHILSHEEMDMMRPIQFNVDVFLPNAPGLSAAGTPGSPINLAWTDGTPVNDTATLGNPANEIGFRIERADGAGAFAVIGTALANETGFADNTTVAGMSYQYRVVAYNAAGESLSNVATVGVVNLPPAAPSNLTATLLSGPVQVSLTWTDNANNETGFVVERSVNGGAFVQIAAPVALAGTGNVTYTDNAVANGNSYNYRVKAVNAGGSSAYSNTAGVTVSLLPAAPSNVTVTAVPFNGTRDMVRLNWTDNANNETGFTIQRAKNAAFTKGREAYRVGANVTTYQVRTQRNVTYYYRIRANNQNGSSAWVNATPFPIVTP